MVAEFIVRTSEGAFSSFLVDRHQTYRFIVTVGWDDIRIITRKVIIIVPLLGDFRVGGISWQIIDSFLLHKGGIGSAAIPLGPAIIILANRPWKDGRRDNLGLVIKLNVVDAHPAPSPIRIITGASETNDVIESLTDLRIHTFQRELRCFEIDIQLCTANKNLGLYQHSVKVDFNPKTRVSWPRIQIKSVESDREKTGRFQRIWKIKVIPQIEIPTGKSPFGRLFIKVH